MCNKHTVPCLSDVAANHSDGTEATSEDGAGDDFLFGLERQGFQVKATFLPPICGPVLTNEHCMLAARLIELNRIDGEEDVPWQCDPLRTGQPAFVMFVTYTYSIPCSD